MHRSITLRFARALCQNAVVLCLWLAALGSPTPVQAQTCGAGQASALYNFTGAEQTVVVPGGLTSATVHLNGAQGNAGRSGAGTIGGSPNSPGGNGGLGGRVSGTLALTPGSTVSIWVGGQGSSAVNPGGSGSVGATDEGRGGGATDIRVGGNAIANRVAIAGGGGGGGNAGWSTTSVIAGGNGGAGGGGAGTAGADVPGGPGPFGGAGGTVGTPRYWASGAAGGTINVIVDGVPVGTATVAAGGTWTFTQPTALADGPHNVRATLTDGLGSTSASSNTNNFSIDTVPPPAPTVSTPANGSVTNDDMPAVSGTSTIGTSVAVSLDGVVAGTVSVDAAGNWTYTSGIALADGPHTVSARASDAVGNLSPVSNTNNFTVDTTAPIAPVVASPANGSSSNDTTPLVSGTAEANANVAVRIDGIAAGSTSANASGNWSFTSAVLAEGVHTVDARATDFAGNVGPFSNVNSFTIDATAPPAPVVDTPANGSSTQDNTPTVSGTAASGSSVAVSLDGGLGGTVTANGGGNWTYTPGSALSDGVHTVSATAADGVGNTSPVSNTNSFTVDTTAPAAPLVVTPADNSITNDNTPMVSGSAEASATVSVRIDGVAVGTIGASAAGTWSFTTAVLADGVHTVSATAADAAGNVGPASNNNSFTVDTQAPAAPVIQSPADGSTTADSAPPITGTAPPSSTVSVRIDGVVVGTAVANGGGNWTLTPPVLTPGLHALSATASDAANNASAPSATVFFTVSGTVSSTTPATIPADASWALALAMLLFAVLAQRAMAPPR